MDEPFDASLQLYEGPVVGDRNHLASHPGADGVLLLDAFPGVRLELLEAERDPLPIPIDVENLDLDLVSDLADLTGMAHAAPRHVGDVQQAVDAAQIDEGAEVGDVLDHALADLTHLELRLQLLALLAALLLEDHTARDDDVAAPLVELEDLEVELLTDEIVDVGDATQRNLGAGEERIDPHDIDGHAAFDLLLDGTADRLVVVIRVLDLLPHAQEVRLLLREDDYAFLVLEPLQEDVDLLTRLDLGRRAELVQRHRALRLEAQVEDRRRVGDTQHLRLDDFTLLDVLEGVLVHREHLFVLLRGVLLLFEEPPSQPLAGPRLLDAFSDDLGFGFARGRRR